MSHTSICVGSPQCEGRRTFQKVPGPLFGVDLTRGGSSGSSPPLAGDDRSFRHQREPPPTKLLRPSIGSSGSGDGCLPAHLGESAGLRLPSVRTDSKGAEQGTTFKGVGTDSGGSVLAPETLVPGPSRSGGGSSCLASPKKRPTSSTPFPSVPSKSPGASASCLETIRRFARHAGCSSKVARQLTFARRSSTSAVYQAKWGVYRKWCRELGHSISSPSVYKIAEFLLYLHDVKRLSIPCIRGYRSMLTTVFRWKIPDLLDSPLLRDLIRSFSNKNPVPRRIPPEWDLTVVLSALTRAPYEPLGTTSFKNLTMKTLFLVSLATTKRVGELQALSKKVAWVGGDMSLQYLPSFVAKTEGPNNPLPRHFRVRSLCEFVGDMEIDRLLCPVRALKFYLAATSSVQPRPRNLFLSPKDRTRPLSKNALSYFIRQVIVDSGALGAAEGPAPRAHSVRGVGASCTFLRNWRVSDVLQAATWKSNVVFAAFYLRDVSYVLDDKRSLGPFISAGGVISKDSGHSPSM